MATLRVTRKNELVGRFSGFEIYLDDQKVGKISAGESVEFNIPEGSHKLSVKLSWCRSRDFHFGVSAGDHKKVTVSYGKYFIMALLSGIVLLMLHHWLSTRAGFKYLILLTIPSLLAGLYYTTAGRNKCLDLEEEATFS